jgi:hypothetical protein
MMFVLAIPSTGLSGEERRLKKEVRFERKSSTESTWYFFTECLGGEHRERDQNLWQLKKAALPPCAKSLLEAVGRSSFSFFSHLVLLSL